MKALVAYFSCTNTTKNVAKTIAQVVDGDMYPIQPKIPYTRSDLNWNDAKSRSSLEMKDLSSRPEIIKDLDIDEYDIIFIGFPIWWYVAPTIIYSFLESYDFRGKTIVPFATSGGSGVGRTDQYLQSCLKDVDLKHTTMLNGHPSQDNIKQWIETILKR